jgi:signal transduction histidine kinase
VDAGARASEAAEVAAYYVAAEALANATRYAGASRISLTVARRNGALEVEVADDGRGGADAGRGTGLRGLADRVEALGGTLSVDSAPGDGTRVAAVIPADA